MEYILYGISWQNIQMLLMDRMEILYGFDKKDKGDGIKADGMTREQAEQFIREKNG